MGWFGVGLALILPWLAGTLTLKVFWPSDSPGAWPLALGYGYPLAMLGGVLALYLLSPLGLIAAFWLLMLVFALLTVVGVRRLSDRRLEPKGLAVRDDMPLGSRLLFVLLLCWIVLRLTGLALEIWWQPLFPWDAWTTWAVRARVWSEWHQLVPFVAPPDWLADASGSVYGLAAWNYPKAVSLLALWPTLAYGGWNESAANLPWLGCAIALAFGFYGQARRWGASPLTSLVGLWLLLSLPLLNTHVALAGYADLWLASALGLSAIAFLHWLGDGDRRQGVLFLLLAAACPFLKLEGGAWLWLFVPAFLAARLGGRWMILALLALVGLGIGVLVLGGARIDLPLIGMIEFSTAALQLPFLGRFELGYHDNWGAFGRALFAQENWHLLGYLLVLASPIALGLVIRGVKEPWRLAALTFVFGSFLMLFLLFFFTDASRWAEQATSLGRLLLHFMPLYVFFLLTLWLRFGAATAWKGGSLPNARSGIHQEGSKESIVSA
ncbi:hypothetical protein [Thiocystis violacea]|uniref:hypothetical protein n=1 Tax=Thiocystis violacea TaxID=13725 RepID=UPI001908E7A3|nr:hypothetical protein [Thiocystis violacea]MBK1718866.1 hypothetical protein [Thiocystis violacea]